MTNGIYLCRPGGSILGAMSGLDENTVQLTQNVGSPWELTFDVMRYLEKDCQLIESTYYRSLSSGMELYLETEQVKARFQIDNEPDIRNEGEYEYKSIVAVSIECELQDKILRNFAINTGTTASLENLVMGNLKEEAVNIYDTTQKFYNYNYNPYLNLPVEYIHPYDNGLKRLAEDFIITDTSIYWREKDITINFTVSNGEIIATDATQKNLLVDAFTAFNKAFPHIEQDIRWVIDDNNLQSLISPPEDKIVCVVENYLSLKNIGGDVHIYLTLPKYTYTLQSDGWHISQASTSVPTIQRLYDGIERLRHFYTQFGSQLSLLDLAIEQVKISGWSIGDIPSSLDDKYFTYNIDGQDIYSFLVKDVASSMKLIVDFDRINKKINLINVFGDDITHDTGVTIGFHNLMNSIDIKSSSSDGIKTKFNVSGADDLGILYSNFGSNSILDLDYFVNKVDEYGDLQYVDQETHDNYKNWIKYRDEDIINVEIPIYEFNSRTKVITSSSTKVISGTRREVYVELSKYYNQSLVDIDEAINLLPNDGVRTDFMTYSYEDLSTAYTAYVNAFNGLLSLYKEDYNVAVMYPDAPYINPNDRIEESDVRAIGYDGQPVTSILDTFYCHDFSGYYYNIIPNVVQALKRFVETDNTTDMNIIMYEDEQGIRSWKYLDGGNPYYNSDSDKLEHLAPEAYKYDMSLYGRDELVILKKSWIEAATKIFKEEFIKSGSSIDNYIYNAWSDLTDEQKAKFMSEEDYESKLNDYLDYTSRDIRQNKLVSEATYGKAYAKDGGNYKRSTKGVIFMAQDEIDKCNELIETLTQMRNEYFDERKAIADSVTLEGYAKTYPMNLAVLNSLIIEADYSNSNILVTNLDSLGISKDGEKTVTDVQVELLEDANKRLFEKSRPQYSFSIDLDNLLNIPEFALLSSSIQLLNYVYVRIGLYDDETVRLRIVKIQNNPITLSDQLTLEFSNMTYTYDGINDLAHLFEEMSGGGSSGGSSGASGGVYGANDAEITLSNNMLNALLKNKDYIASVNTTIMQAQRIVTDLLEAGEIRVGDYATTGELINGLKVTKNAIESRVSSSIDTWDTHEFSNTINYGFGLPDSSILPPSEHTDEYYLNQSTGQIYQSNGNTWNYVKQLSKINDTYNSRIYQNSQAITAEVTARTQFQNDSEFRMSTIEVNADNLRMGTYASWFYIDPYDWNDVIYIGTDLDDAENPEEHNLAFIYTDWDDNDNPIEGCLYEYMRDDTEDPLTWQSIGYYNKTVGAAEIVTAVNASGSEIRLSADKVRTGTLTGLTNTDSWINLDNGKFHFGGSNGYIDWNNIRENSLSIRTSSPSDLMLNNVPVAGYLTNYDVSPTSNVADSYCLIYEYPSYFYIDGSVQMSSTIRTNGDVVIIFDEFLDNVNIVQGTVISCYYTGDWDIITDSGVEDLYYNGPFNEFSALIYRSNFVDNKFMVHKDKISANDTFMFAGVVPKLS